MRTLLKFTEGKNVFIIAYLRKLLRFVKQLYKLLMMILIKHLVVYIIIIMFVICCILQWKNLELMSHMKIITNTLLTNVLSILLALQQCRILTMNILHRMTSELGNLTLKLRYFIKLIFYPTCLHIMCQSYNLPPVEYCNMIS